MIQILKRITTKFGVDRAILYTSFTRIAQTLGNVISLLLIVKFLSGVEQGFYYTFGSIVAIQLFFELGLNGIITQYVAHEASNLQWQNETSLIGESKYLSRLSSLLHFSVKWYVFFSTILLTALIIVGFIFFESYNSGKEVILWTTPWIILALGTALNLFIAPILAFLEGLGKVKEIAKIRLIQQFVIYPIVWGGFLFGAKLFVPGFSSLAGAMILIIIVYLGNYKKILINIWRVKNVEKIHYRREIFPYQWKIALSWMSGYLIFQLFNPVLFVTDGAVVAGQMGMSLAALNGVFSLSYSWMSTKIPLFSTLIAQRKYTDLDNIFNKTLRQSVFVNFFALSALFLGLILIRYYNIKIGQRNLGSRFLDYIPFFFMLVPSFINQITASWAIYLRCHKQEPFLINSIVGGILCSTSTIVLGKYFGVMGITSGYCFLTLIGVPWGYYIYKTKRKEWHISSIH